MYMYTNIYIFILYTVDIRSHFFGPVMGVQLWLGPHHRLVMFVLSWFLCHT
jgi:hypothetical protein